MISLLDVYPPLKFGFRWNINSILLFKDPGDQFSIPRNPFSNRNRGVSFCFILLQWNTTLSVTSVVNCKVVSITRPNSNYLISKFKTNTCQNNIRFLSIITWSVGFALLLCLLRTLKIVLIVYVVHFYFTPK